MIYHFIRFALAPNATPDQLATFQRSLEAARNHPDAKQVIIGRLEDPHVLVGGRNVGDLEGGYTHAMMMIFENEAAYERYVTSRQFNTRREEGVPVCAKVAGFDFIDDWDVGTPARIRAIRKKRGRLSTDPNDP